MKADSAGRTSPATHGAAWVSAFVFLAGALALLSCRDLGPQPAAGASVAVIRYLPGDSLIFSRYNVTGAGFEIARSRRTVSWYVRSANDGFAGRDSVTTILEYDPGDTVRAVPDTIRFRFLENGDIERFGYLSAVALRRDSSVYAPAWDRIAAFSLGTGGTWLMGPVGADSTDIVRGRVTAYQDYVTVSVNGLPRIVPASTVSLSASYFYGEVSVSQNPVSIVRLLVNAVPGGTAGEVTEATSMKTSLP
jgi:hypothetical protein